MERTIERQEINLVEFGIQRAKPIEVVEYAAVEKTEGFIFLEHHLN